jgi:hypothetical protein
MRFFTPMFNDPERCQVCIMPQEDHFSGWCDDGPHPDKELYRSNQDPHRCLYGADGSCKVCAENKSEDLVIDTFSEGFKRTL